MLATTCHTEKSTSDSISYLRRKSGVVVGLSGDTAEVHALAVTEGDVGRPSRTADIFTNRKALLANAAYAATAQSAGGFLLLAHRTSCRTHEPKRLSTFP